MAIRFDRIQEAVGVVGQHLRNHDPRVVSTDREIYLADAVYTDIRAEKDVYGKLENVGRLMDLVENPRDVYKNLEGVAALYDVVLRGKPEDRAFDFGIGVFMEFIEKERKAETEDLLAAQGLMTLSKPTTVESPQYIDEELTLKEEDNELGLDEIYSEMDRIMSRNGIRM